MAAMPSGRLASAMSLLLHLSDLHLANTPDEDAVGDYKVRAVAERDIVTRAGLLGSTLEALSRWLATNGETLDGIIITGDITTRGRPEGFGKLPGLLAELGEALPEASRIVVVPGNHDVAWDTQPGTADRYRAFIEGVRQKGYVTPLLDGIDYSGEPRLAPGPLLTGLDFAIIAIDSADMCGVIEPFTVDAEDELERLKADHRISDSLQREIQRVRRYDMPRISDRQMSALGAMMDQIPADLVRIAALHHQLVPVREEEEVKPFESIVNIGAFSEFLSEAQVDVIAHGHKHADHVQTITLGGTTPSTQRQAVIASCGTIGGASGTRKEIAKLIRVVSDLPTLRRIEILTVPAVGAGRRLPKKLMHVYDEPTWRPSSATSITVIGGTSVTDVHERLLEAGRSSDHKPMRDVICVVDQGPTALEPPASYPPPEEGTNSLPEWFKDIVEWWQDPERADGKPFTHGQRLHHWSGDQDRNQLEAITKILRQDATTSRGIAVLVNPDTDDVAQKEIEFPSFSLLHLWIDDGALNCTAFFRKQEMTYWWAVNVAEVARIQADVLRQLRSPGEELRPGAIRTYASEAVFSDQLPKVNVPRVDRLFWRDPDSLRLLAVAIADVDIPRRDDDIITFISLMEDWAPHAEAPPTDGAAVPTRGLTALASMLAALADRYPTSSAHEIGDLLREMDDANLAYLTKRDTGDALRAYKQWRTSQLRRIDSIHRLLAYQSDERDGM
jgi:3',5'-cyclic AMP phosphodiesterase CpdA